MSRYLPIILLFLQVVTTFAQKEDNIWYFGRNAGIDFSTGSPAVLTNGALNTSEGAATICDKNGNLLFYTDGQRVWNRNHSQMPNGTGLAGHSSGTSSALIVPRPGNPNRYYIFTAGSHDQYSGNPAAPILMAWSEVDMTLSGGLGDVVTATKNTPLFTGSTEKIAAVRHANGLYFWVITQRLSDGAYQVYPVDCNGIGNPIINNTGIGNITSGLGYLKLSPDGRRLANAIWAVGNFLYDFDNATGNISNRIDLGLPSNHTYGLSFSPNSNVLYSVSLSDGVMYQWNLTAGSAAAIIASRITVGNAGGTGSPYRGGAIQSGPDNKLYFIQYNQPYLGVIHSPDIVGAGCNLQQNVVNLQSRNGVLGLPTFIQRNTDTTIINHAGYCTNVATSFSITGAVYLDSVRWNFGDPPSGTLNTSGNINPAHQYTTAGVYTVRLIKYLDCISDTTYTTVRINSTPIVDLGPDTSTCGDTLILSSAVTYTSPSWLWNNGATTPTRSISQTGTYWLQVTENGCTGVDTILIDISPNLAVDLGPDFNICDRDTPVILHTEQMPGTHYLWSNGLSDTVMRVTRTGTYWVKVERNRCQGSDTIRIGIIPTPFIYIGADSIICEQFPARIGTEIAGATYLWNTGEPTPYINVNSTDNYILEVNLDGCIVYDTIEITAMAAPDIDLGDDDDICPEQTIALDGSYTIGSSYLWNTGEVTSSISVSSEGVYSVQVISEYGCIGTDSIILSYYPKPVVMLSADTTVCEETPLTIYPRFINTDSLIWSEGSVGNTLTVRYGGEYVVTAVNKCGTDTDTILVKQIFCDIMLPNAFTPDGDGINDIFRVLGNIGRAEGFRFSIFSRWGELLFHTQDKYNGWDGVHKGQPAQLGTYVYLLEYSIEHKPYIQKGNFHLIR